ncbi:MAG: Smr/MutS family protein [Dongiaceae bacterium]
MAKRPVSPSDLDLWRKVAASAKPLPGRARSKPAPAAPPPTPAASSSSPALPPLLSPPPRRPPPELTPGRIAGVDKRLAERLRRGQLPIEATLDLHGLTQGEAHDRLAGFIAVAAAAGRRCVLVITGKGMWRTDGGVLREMVPRWLNEAPTRGRVLALAPAQPRHGGAGALYLLLKRLRPE